MFKTLIISILILLAGVCAYGAPGNVKGHLIDAETGQPMEFVTVSITDASGKLLTGGITDLEGNFEIKGLKVGQYTLTCSYMGYLPINIPINITRNNQTADIGNHKMKVDAAQLEEVQVTGKASQMRFELDRKVFDATQSLAAEGGSVSDLLATVPSVEVDNDGGVSLRGNSSVTIWINGKASGLSAENQADILQLMPADNIKQIEVITNPSAKYSPEGTAGIINIILKEDHLSGYFGSIKGGGNTNGGYRLSGNVTINLKKVDFGVDISRRHRATKGGSEVLQTVFESPDKKEEEVVSILTQDGDQENSGNNWFGRFTFNWHPTPKNDFGIVLSGMKGDGEGNEEIDYLQMGDGANRNNLNQLFYTSTRRSDDESENQMYHIEFSYRHQFSDTHVLDYSLSNFGWKNDREATYQQSYNYTDISLARPSLCQIQNTNNDNKNWETQLDYSVLLAEVLKMELGYKGTFQRNLSPTQTLSGETAVEVKEDLALYNDFKYDQDVHAGYLTLGGKMGNLNMQGGVRIEQWEFDTRSYGKKDKGDGTWEQTEESAKRDFLKFFPSLYISYALPSGNEVQLNYSRRLRRPWGGQLNPFRNISDALNIRFGNPELTPEYTNAFELNYIKMWESGQTLSFSAYLRMSEDVMDNISFSQGNVLFNTTANVTDRTSSGLELIGKNRIAQWFELTTTLNLYYQKIEAYRYEPKRSWLVAMTGSESINGVIEGDEQKNFNWNVRMIANFSLPWDISLQATGDYRAKQKGVQGYTKPMGNLNLGLKKAFLKDRFVLNINGRNVLNTRKFRRTTEGEMFTQDSKRWRNGCVINATLTWKFGNMMEPKSDRPGEGGPNGDDSSNVRYSDGGGDD
ncbi:MAG: TonB-dependent receptor [Marinilabiliaceae bacterium]|nr:TonB-dependent receptor [Marinilabiliaceae bacterium]